MQDNDNNSLTISGETEEEPGGTAILLHPVLPLSTIIFNNEGIKNYPGGQYLR